MSRSAAKIRSKARNQASPELSQLLTEIGQEAKEKGLDKISMREINEIIAEVRREHDPLSGQTHRVNVSLSERMYREAKAAAQSAGWDLAMLVRQAIGDFLRQLERPHAPKNVIFTESERRQIAKAIKESTPRIKPYRRYKPT